MNDGMILQISDDGKATLHESTYDITIHCESEKEQREVMERLNSMSWIPVSERLPENDKDVLVTRHFLSDKQLKKNAITETFYVEVASRMDDEWTSYSDEYKIKRHLHKVLAWMPLPEPYKEGEQNETD